MIRKRSDIKILGRGTLIVLFVAMVMVSIAVMPSAIAGKPTTPPAAFSVYSVDSVGDVGHYTRIALDSQNNVHMTYYDATNYALKYATNTGGPWKLETIATVGSRYDAAISGVADIAVDSLDNVHIVYRNIDHNLVYVHKVGGSWVSATLDSDIWGQFSMVVDKQDRIHISYYEDSMPNQPTIEYASNSAGLWTIETVAADANLSWSVQMALDSNGGAHIIYLNLSDYKLSYATRENGRWVSQVLELGGQVAADASMAIDSNNNVHLSYFTHNGQLQQQVLRYANNAGGVWSNMIIDPSGDIRYDSSIAVDRLGKAHICYNDYGSASKMNLMYATNAGGSWQIKLVDGSRNVGLQNDMAVDSQQKVHISYLDNAYSNLKYAKSI
jgi:hypothetical protein